MNCPELATVPADDPAAWQHQGHLRATAPPSHPVASTSLQAVDAKVKVMQAF
jgi:hypothetical protein